MSTRAFAHVVGCSLVPLEFTQSDAGTKAAHVRSLENQLCNQLQVTLTSSDDIPTMMISSYENQQIISQNLRLLAEVRG